MFLQDYNAEGFSFTFDFGNQTSIDELYFTGFPQSLHMKLFLFFGLLFTYILTMLGNSLLICTVVLSPQLHTAMYYFFCNLSFIDLCYLSTISPQILFDIFSEKRRISVIACLLQMYIGLILGGTEYVLLAVMAYDRYIAICVPLHYTTIISRRTCINLTIIIWLLNLMLHGSPPILKPFVFCKGNKVNHFACDSLALIELICGDIYFYKLIMFIGSLFVLFLPLVFIIVSYICIIVSVLKINSAEGRSKAFSTCASHLTVVFMLYGTNMTRYMGQAKNSSSNIKYISIIYLIVIPLLNPFIYSLRNNEVKKAFWKMLTRYPVSHSS